LVIVYIAVIPTPSALALAHTWIAVQNCLAVLLWMAETKNPKNRKDLIRGHIPDNTA